MENKNLNDQTMINEADVEQPVKKTKKIFGVPVKTLLWVLFGIGTAVGGYYTVKKYRAGKNNASTNTANEVEVEQPQVEEKSTTSQENKNDRYHNNSGYKKNGGRWDNNNTNN